MAQEKRHRRAVPKRERLQTTIDARVMERLRQYANREYVTLSIAVDEVLEAGMDAINAKRDKRNKGGKNYDD